MANLDDMKLLSPAGFIRPRNSLAEMSFHIFPHLPVSIGAGKLALC